MKRRLLYGFLGAVVLFTFMVLLAVLAGAKFNLSRSYPLGLYWDTRTRVKKNDLVFFAPPRTPIFDLAKSRGYIDSNAFGECQAMIKKIVASGGILFQSLIRA